MRATLSTTLYRGLVLLFLYLLVELAVCRRARPPEVVPGRGPGMVIGQAETQFADGEVA